MWLGDFPHTVHRFLFNGSLSLHMQSRELIIPNCAYYCYLIPQTAFSKRKEPFCSQCVHTTVVLVSLGEVGQFYYSPN